MLNPTGRYRAIQIHPTRRCNLECLHCYSLSGPKEREELPPELLLQLISDAKIEGYTEISISGGEPLLYKPLPKILSHARSLGMVTTITTNGTLFKKNRVASLKDANLVAISIDGIPESHNRMRNNDKAFLWMKENLDEIRKSNIPYGFIFTLTQENLTELPWVANFAHSNGAALLQIHPLELNGRARSLLKDSKPDFNIANYAYLTSLQLYAQYGEHMHIQLDYISESMISDNPSRFFVCSDEETDEDRTLSDLVAPLIVEQNGTVVPLQYGFPKEYMLGNIYKHRLRSMGQHWRKKNLNEFRKLCMNTFTAIKNNEDSALVNWYEMARKVQDAQVYVR